MRVGDAADLGQPLHRPGFVRRSVHAVLGAQQTAQKRRVLGRNRVGGFAFGWGRRGHGRHGGCSISPVWRHSCTAGTEAGKSCEAPQAKTSTVNKVTVFAMDLTRH